MESHSSHLHNKSICYKTESRSKNQHQEATVPLSMRGGTGSFRVKNGVKLINSPMQTKTPTNAVTPTTLAAEPATASTATSRTLLVPAATTSSITSTTILLTKIPEKHADGITQCTTLTAGISEYKIKYSREGEGELKTSSKNSSKHIHKTMSQISAYTDLQKSLQKTPPGVVTTRTALPKTVQQTTFSQIPNSVSNLELRSSPTPTIAVDQAEISCKGRSKEVVPSLSCKFNNNRACVMEDSQDVHSVQPLGTKQSKVEMLQWNEDEEKNRDKKGEEGIFKDIQVGCTLRESDITLQVSSKCSLFSLDKLQLSPGATTTSASLVNETAGMTDGNAMAQERQCEREKSREWKEGIEERKTLEKRSGQKGKAQEKKTKETIEKERNGQDTNSEAKEKERQQSKMEVSIQEKKSNQIFKSFKDAATMTEENPVPVQTLDAAMQTELLYEDSEIQAVVEVSNMFTTMSPNMTHPPWSQMDHEKVSGPASMSLENGHDVSLDSGLAPRMFASVGSMAKSLSPTPNKSSISSKPNQQHVCQIEIELFSQSTLSDSLSLLDEKNSQAYPTRSGLEREPKQVDRDQDQAEMDPFPEVAWDEQGMTWEVYGAAVDMEYLGCAIQNHLQRKIQEHEQHIRHLRKSVSLSEHSNGDQKRARKKKKKKKKKKKQRNIFWSLFQRPTCCLKTKSEA